MHPSLLSRLQSPADLKHLSLDGLTELAAEIRSAICDQVAQSGGHLAPNLGVVDLTIAMHRVFDFGHDRLLFDVGHQCYPHKLLTGRYPLFSKLRTRGGMAGFPEPSESNYDLFSVGHAGTAISTAVGMARGDSLNNECWSVAQPLGRRVVSLIGDASICNGVAMEGLNNAGTLKRQFLVVLNDNGMSIAKPQGALAAYFDRLRLSHTYGEFKRRAKEIAKRMPGGHTLSDAYHAMGEVSKTLISEETWFEHFGLVTVGPVDGHDIPTLIDVLNEAALQTFITDVVARHGQLDAVVNAVGGYAAGSPPWEMPADALDKMLALNLRSGYLLLRNVVPTLLAQRHGAIVNIAAVAAVQHVASAAEYVASKAAAVAMVDSAAANLKGTGVRANSVLPSIINTASNRAAMPDADHAAWPTPEDIARVILFLCSDDARLVNGAAIAV